VVCKGCLRGVAVAVKRQRMAKCPREDTVGGHPLAETGSDYARLMHEIHVSAQLPAHPNICRFHGACLDSQDRTVLNLVYEYVDGSDIERMYAKASMHERDWRPPLDQALSWCIQLAAGLARLHGCRPTAFVHRDIKPSNLLISADLEVLKICDFGLCTVRQFDEEGNMLAPARPMTGGTGSYRYMAPEVLSNCGSYDTSVDIFSAACCFFFILNGKPVMAEIEDACEVAAAVLEDCRQPLDMLVEHPALAATVAAAWDSEPARRPSAAALVGLLREHRASSKAAATSHSSARSASKMLMHGMSAVRDSVMSYVTGRRRKGSGSTLPVSSHPLCASPKNKNSSGCHGNKIITSLGRVDTCMAGNSYGCHDHMASSHPPNANAPMRLVGFEVIGGANVPQADNAAAPVIGAGEGEKSVARMPQGAGQGNGRARGNWASVRSITLPRQHTV
jgi:serine/threonine protein kinase